MAENKQVAIDESPNSLEQPKIDQQKNGKKLIAQISVCVIAMLLILYFSLFGGSGPAEKIADPPKVTTEDKPLVPASDAGEGLALPIETRNLDGDASKVELPKDGQLNVNVIADEKDPIEEALRREQEELRRLKAQNAQAGLISPLNVHRTGVSNVQKSGNYQQPQSGSGADNMPLSVTGEYDPAAAKDREAFFARADTTKGDGWISPYTREKGRSFELKTGTVIPGIMISGINSDLPGNLIAQTAQDVYDTANGRDLLIPKGSRLYGVYDSRVVYGQKRVLVAWNRIIFPDGSSVTLGAMPGTDISGYAGFHDLVDNHYLRIFGSAVLMSLITGASSYAVDQVSNTSTESNKTTVQDEMASALAAQLNQTTLNLLQKNLSIAPTLEIRNGYRFNIVLTKDIVFEGAYAR